MNIVLQNNLIHIKMDYKYLAKSWMKDLFEVFSNDLLFLPKAILIFDNAKHNKDRVRFLSRLADFYSREKSYDGDFYYKALKVYSSQPIKIELINVPQRHNVSVELYAHDSSSVVISLFAPNTFVMGYIKSQMDMYIINASDTSVVLNVESMKAKTRLEKLLNKRHILNNSIQYSYDSNFMQRLYGDFAGFDFEDDEVDEKVSEFMHYYTVLECPVGASRDILKDSYKKLVKIYHPDKIFNDSPDLVTRYTQKFQLLQEAYTALRVVS